MPNLCKFGIIEGIVHLIPASGKFVFPWCIHTVYTLLERFWWISLYTCMSDDAITKLYSLHIYIVNFSKIERNGRLFSQKKLSKSDLYKNAVNNWPLQALMQYRFMMALYICTLHMSEN